MDYDAATAQLDTEIRRHLAFASLCNGEMRDAHLRAADTLTDVLCALGAEIGDITWQK